jgi:glycosyltransferase involved in cell wall biosynthesis
MPRLSAIAAIVAYNVEETLPTILKKFPYDQVDEVLVVDDGSQDNTATLARAYPVTVIQHGANKGVGAAIKTGLKRALDCDCDVFLIMAGNGKDNPDDISRFLLAINEGFDYVQG